MQLRQEKIFSFKESVDDWFLYFNEKELIINAPKLLEVHSYQSHKELYEIVEENKEKLEAKEDKSYEKVKSYKSR